MPKLKKKKVEYWKVDYYELDCFIKEVYGQNFNVVADIEGKNDSSHSILVEKAEIDEYSKEELERWKTTGKGSYMLGTIMTDLANQELIEEGNYLIEICW